MTEKIDIKKIADHWLSDSDKDYDTMLHLYHSKDYSWSLFIGHIVLEKLLKSVIVKVTKDHAPFTHELVKLSALTKLEFSEEQLDWLDTITAFNLNARYDNYKQAFTRKCTLEFTKDWIEKIKLLRTWIKEKQ